MLTFLPFEAAFYAEHRVPVAYVGHPLADELPLVNDRAAAREALELDPATPTLALLPGSRSNEVLPGRDFPARRRGAARAAG